MTNPMIDPGTSAELYPIPDETEVRRFIFGRVRRQRDPATGKMVIDSHLTTVERELIQKRLRTLAGPLEPAKDGKIRSAVLQMFSGLGGQKVASDEEGAAIVAQYVVTLRGLPLFAIRQACLRFARGEVTAAELGEDTIIKGIRPATAYLRIVAEKVVRPYWDEASLGSMLLSALVQLPAPAKTEANREEVRKMVEDTARKLAAADEADRRKQVEEGIRREDEHRKRQRQMVLAEYDARGLDPVYWDKEKKTMPVALPTLFSMGWTIEEGPGGKPVLLKPRESAA